MFGRNVPKFSMTELVLFFIRLHKAASNLLCHFYDYVLGNA